MKPKARKKIAIASASWLSDMKEDRRGTKPSDVKRGKINKVSEREKKVQSDKIALLPFFQTLAHGQ